MRTVLFALAIQSLSTAAFAAPSYDSKSPACEVPVFHWTSSVRNRDANQNILASTAGSIEATQTKWDPKIGRGDLAGRGAYFEADPFSSQSYGNQLVIGYLKPSQPAKDVRALGDLDEPAMAKKAAAAIRSESPLLVHSWISKLGSSDAVVIRGRTRMKLSDLPFNLTRTELVTVTPGDAKFWSEHEGVLATDTLGLVLQKYSDRLIDLFSIWNASESEMSDDQLWNLVKADVSRSVNDAVGEMDVDRSGSHWEPLDSCGDFESAPQLEAAVKLFKDAKLLSSDAAPSNACELKQSLIANFKTTASYQRISGVYSYLQKYKRSLGIGPLEEDSEKGVSTLSATCKAL